MSSQKVQRVIDDLTIQSMHNVLEHQRRVQALEVETATLVRDRAKVELETQRFIREHVVDATAALELKPWAGGGSA